MKLYFSPLACSLASRIAAYEAGADIAFEEIDPKTKKTRAGADFFAVSPLGMVPALELDDGAVLTENAAILQYIAARHPDARLAPTDALGRARLQQMLSFTGTELHKALYLPHLDKRAPTGAKEYATSKMGPRLGWLASRLAKGPFALGDFSVADAYLFAVLNWSSVTPVDLTPYPAITAYQGRLRERASVKKAFAEERTLYAEEVARHATA